MWTRVKLSPPAAPSFPQSSALPAFKDWRRGYRKEEAPAQTQEAPAEEAAAKV
jgi:hypothetical protein